jgi:hypothetical protein
MRGLPQRILVGLLGTVALALFAACPKPGPAPVTPDAADAAPAVSCDDACKHADAICPGSGSPCLPACNRIARNDSGYAPCVASAKACGDLRGCDPGAR